MKVKARREGFRGERLTTNGDQMADREQGGQSRHAAEFLVFGVRVHHIVKIKIHDSFANVQQK